MSKMSHSIMIYFFFLCCVVAPLLSFSALNAQHFAHAAAAPSSLGNGSWMLINKIKTLAVNFREASVVYDKYAYFVSKNQGIFQVDMSTGKLKSNQHINQWAFYSEPAYAQDSLYAAASSGQDVCLLVKFSLPDLGQVCQAQGNYACNDYSGEMSSAAVDPTSGLFFGTENIQDGSLLGFDGACKKQFRWTGDGGSESSIGFAMTRPAVYKGKVYVCETSSYELCQADIAKPVQGKNIAKNSNCAPGAVMNAWNDTIFASLYQEGFAAFDPATLKRKWLFSGAEKKHGHSIIWEDKKMIFVGMTSAFYALGTADGKPVWQYPADSSSRGKAAFWEEKQIIINAFDKIGASIAFDAVSGTPLFQFLTPRNIHPGPALWNGTIAIADDSDTSSGATIYIYSPCAGYAEAECPLACREKFGACSCLLATTQEQCENPFVARQCTWCSYGICAPRHPANGAAVCDCSQYDVATCTKAAANNGGCVLCQSQNQLCDNPGPKACDCQRYDKNRCTKAGAGCFFCEHQNVCNFPNNTECRCDVYSPEICQQANNFSSSSCHYCPSQTICLPSSTTCDCENLSPTLCNQTHGNCHVCAGSICTSRNNAQCSCVGYGPKGCGIASALCHWCDNEQLCVHKGQGCECFGLPQHVCNQSRPGTCSWCGDAQSVCSKTCSCEAHNATVCAAAAISHGCEYCPKLRTCAFTNNTDCDCFGLVTELGCDNARDSKTNQRMCAWCPEFGICTNRKNYATGENFAKPCACEHFTTEIQCAAANSSAQPDQFSSCLWCSGQGLCQSKKENPQCSCQFYNHDYCSIAQLSGGCHWCGNQTKGSCTFANNSQCLCSGFLDEQSCSKLPSSQCNWCSSSSSSSSSSNSNSNHTANNGGTCVAFNPDFPICSCYSLPTGICDDASSGCRVMPKVFGPRLKPHDYCAPAAIAACAPLTCESIGTRRELCIAAECEIADDDDLCVPGSQCLQFFLDRMVPQSYLLFFLGALKDVFILVLFGSTMLLQRYFAKMKHSLLHYFALEKTPAGPSRLDDTVYISDALCRDDREGSFSDHVSEICEELFVWSTPPTLKLRQKLFDAVAFSMIGEQRWVEVSQAKTRYAARFTTTATASSSARASSAELQSGGGDDNKPLLAGGGGASSSPSVGYETASSTSGGAGATTGSGGGGGSGSQDTVLRRRKLRVQTVEKDEPAFFELVDRVIEARTSYFVFYAHSRDRARRLTSSIASFPDTAQLLFYCAGILLMFISSLASVLSQQNELDQIARGCGSAVSGGGGGTGMLSTTTTATSIPPALHHSFSSSSSSLIGDSTSSSPSSSAPSVAAVNLSTTSFFILGWRLLNASAFSTFSLVLVKLIRALWQARNIDSLELEKRIPILTIRSSRGVQVLLAVYGLLVLPFALAGPTYGWTRGWQCGVPVVVGAVLIVLDFFFMRFLHRVGDDPFSDVESDSDRSDGIDDMLNDEEARTRGGGGNDADDVDDDVEDVDDDGDDDDLGNDRISSPREGAAQSSSQHNRHLNSGTSTAAASGGGGGPQGVVHNKKQPVAVAAPQLIETKEPRTLGRAVLEFLVEQEVIVLIVAISLQMSFNYTALLQFPHDFNLAEHPSHVFARDSDGRSLACAMRLLEGDLSAMLSDLSSFLPWL